MSKNLLKDNYGFIIDYTYNAPCKFESKSPFYASEFVTRDKNVHVKTEKDKIYYLAPILKEDLTSGTLEERVYTISEDKLNYRVLSSYKITEVCGQAW